MKDLTVTQLLAIIASWTGARIIAWLVKEPIAIIICVACTYYFSKLVVTGSTDS